jgi:hypothetical protein
MFEAQGSRFKEKGPRFKAKVARRRITESGERGIA